MRKKKAIFGLGLTLLFLGIVAIFFSQMLIEDILQFKRTFGEEPLSLRFVRAGLISVMLGAGLLIYAGWSNLRRRR
jgi:ABC-type nickel/cobalt efflux system permease component RcnA